MPRKISDKEVQVHAQCTCGIHSVHHEILTVRFKDFRKAGIKRAKDKTTRTFFNFRYIKYMECNCYDDEF